MEAWSLTDDALGRIELAFVDAPIATAIYSPHGMLLHANEAIKMMLAGVWGRLLAEAIDDELLVRNARSWDVERHLEAADDAFHTRISFVRSRHDNGDQVVVQVVDVTEARLREEGLLRLSEREPLTDLWNRRRFEKELGRELERCRRSAAVRATLVVLDVDGLKQVNDRLGHLAGDAVIRRVAETLEGRLRRIDSLARIGGDEFAILLADAADESAQRAVDDLCATVAAQRVAHAGEELALSISAGYVDVAPAALDADALFAAADRALYQAKVGVRGTAVRAA